MSSAAHNPTHFLQKPFTPVALARKVREVLDAPASWAGYAAAPEGGKTWPAAGPWWAFQRAAAGRLGTGRCGGRATLDDAGGQAPHRPLCDGSWMRLPQEGFTPKGG